MSSVGARIRRRRTRTSVSVIALEGILLDVKSRIILFAVAIIMVAGLTLHTRKLAEQAETDGPAVKSSSALIVSPSEVDLGTIKQGEVVTGLFTIENPSSAPITITSIRPHCGCTTTSVEGSVVQPRAKLPMSVSYNSRGRHGRQRVEIEIHTDQPTQPKVSVFVKVFIDSPIEIIPTNHVLFGKVRVGDKPTSAVEILPRKPGATLELLELTSQTGDVVVDVEALIKDRRTGVRAIFSLRSGLGIGTVQTQVTGWAKIGDRIELLEFDVGAVVEGRLSLRPPRLSTSRKLMPGQRISKIRVDSATDAAFEIVSVEVDSPLAVEVEALPGRRRYEVAVSLIDRAPPGPFAGVLRVYTDDVLQPVLKAPVFGTVADPIEVQPPEILITPACAERSIRLCAADDDDWSIKSVARDVPSLELDYSADENNAACWIITVKVINENMPGDGSVTVETTHPLAPTIRIPVRILRGERGSPSSDDEASAGGTP